MLPSSYRSPPRRNSSRRAPLLSRQKGSPCSAKPNLSKPRRRLQPSQHLHRLASHPLEVAKMTTNPYTQHGSVTYEVLPEDLLRARDRVAQRHAKAARSIGRRQTRRRFLPAAVVGSALLVTAGLADRFVQSSLPRPAATVSPPTSSTASPNNALALAQVTQTLAADQKAIVQIAKAQAQLARSAGGDGGGSVAVPILQLPSLANLPSIPSVSVPSISVPTATSPAPATNATTGASVVVP